MAGATTMAMVHIGDELGLYQAMAGAGPMSAGALAEAVGLHPRLVTEWLRSRPRSGLVELEGEGDDDAAFELTNEAAAVLAWEVSPSFLAGGIGMFRRCSPTWRPSSTPSGDGGLPWGDHHPCLFTSTSRFFRPQYEMYLANEWLPAADGIHELLRAGATAADVGCGCGDSVHILASAYPQSRFTGIDFHGPSIHQAIEQAAANGLDNASFEVADSKGYQGNYDVIFFLDCLHDMGEPGGDRRPRPQPAGRGRVGAHGGAICAGRPCSQFGREPNGGHCIRGFGSVLHPVFAGPTRRLGDGGAVRRGGHAGGVQRGGLFQL